MSALHNELALLVALLAQWAQLEGVTLPAGRVVVEPTRGKKRRILNYSLFYYYFFGVIVLIDLNVNFNVLSH